MERQLWSYSHRIQLVILAYAENRSLRTTVEYRNFNHVLIPIMITVPDVVTLYEKISTSPGT